MTRISGTVHEDRYMYIRVIFCGIIFKMRNISDKSCREDQNTHFIFNNFFPKIVPFMSQSGKI
jgi:hypothetical protein